MLWVLATNVGFFPGLALGNQLSASVAEPVSSAVVGGMFAAMVGVAQWAVLRRHLPSTHHWITATTIGWVLGAGLGALLLIELAPNVTPGGVTWIIVIGFFAGAIVGIPQYAVLRKSDPALARWWVAISSLAWGIFFPGAVSGLFLARRLQRVV